MTASINCINLIKKFEGVSLKPYLCPAGVPTIGFGSTMYEDGTKVTLKDGTISLLRAQELLNNTLKGYSDAVSNMLHVSVSQNQFDALVDFAYNLGIAALQGSTLLKKINNKDFAGASGEFAKWVNANGHPLAGLIVRREAEKELFNA
jgi:lysozyme